MATAPGSDPRRPCGGTAGSASEIWSAVFSSCRTVPGFCRNVGPSRLKVPGDHPGVWRGRRDLSPCRNSSSSCCYGLQGGCANFEPCRDAVRGSCCAGRWCRNNFEASRGDVRSCRHGSSQIRSSCDGLCDGLEGGCHDFGPSRDTAPRVRDDFPVRRDNLSRRWASSPVRCNEMGRRRDNLPPLCDNSPARCHGMPGRCADSGGFRASVGPGCHETAGSGGP